MTRKNSRFLDRFRDAFRTVDSSFVDRSDVNDVSKIHLLEQKMSDDFGMFDDIKFHTGKLVSNSNLKSNLKNSKRF